MPKNTQMHMQWITVNGQSVPLVLPQYWDGEKWVISSEQNPLPVKAELTGRNIERVVLFESVAIDSTTAREADVPASIANKVDEMYLVVYNTLDADVQIRYLTNIRGNVDPIRNAESAIIEYVMPASQAFAPRIITKDDMPILASPTLLRNGDIKFQVAARTTPTEGVFSMWAFLKMGRN